MPGRRRQPRDEEGADDDDDGEEALPGRVQRLQPRERRPLHVTTPGGGGAIGGVVQLADRWTLQMGIYNACEIAKYMYLGVIRYYLLPNRCALFQIN